LYPKGTVPLARGWPPAAWWMGGCAAGDLDGFGGSWGKISESRPPMRRPALKLSSRCPKNGSAGDPHLPCPPRWGVGVCTGPASKKRIVRQPLSAATTCEGCAENAQAIFCRRRHQPRRPPLAKIRPGSPAPTIGPGTGCGLVALGVARITPPMSPSGKT
jgi:hypothetical protein